MIRFGLRLTIATGREAAIRFVTVAAAVAIGAGMLLATLAGINAVNSQNDRYAWLNTSITHSSPTAGSPAHDPVWWLIRDDYFEGRRMGRIDLAATGPDSPVPPGIQVLPGPGEFYASPAMSRLLATTPADQLGDRFPGHQIGTIGDPGLPSPDSLLIVIGRAPGELEHAPDAQQITHIASLAPGQCDDCGVGKAAAGMDLVLSVVALAMLFPVLIFIGAATRLAAARREQRFAAMRLVGATPRQVSVIAAVESTTAAAVGVALGFALFFAFRGPLASIPFTGESFFRSDLSLSWLDIALVAVGVPIGAAIAARLALRRVRISPLGVARRVTPRAPRAYRLIPLVAGIAELAYFVGRRPMTSNGQTAAFLPGFFLIMGGLIAAGPWLTMVGARVLARRSSRPATLIAARRLADNPKAAFRAVSGLIIALFVTSVATGVITTIVANRGVQPSNTLAYSTLSEYYPSDVKATVPSSLSSVPGVRNVIVVRGNPDEARVGDGLDGHLPGLVSCAELAKTPAFGRCAPGAAVAAVWPGFVVSGDTPDAATVWPTVSRTAADLDRLPLVAINVLTDGSHVAIERARTDLDLANPNSRFAATTEGEFDSDFTQTLGGWRQLADMVILISLPIAGCSLAVSVAGGLTDRKRPFSLLRLTGVPLGLLRRVVALESAVPLLVVALAAIGIGFLSAQLFLKAQMHYSLIAPELSYYGLVVVGLLASLGIIGVTLPLLRRITGPETARNE